MIKWFLIGGFVGLILREIPGVIKEQKQIFEEFDEEFYESFED